MLITTKFKDSAMLERAVAGGLLAGLCAAVVTDQVPDATLAAALARAGTKVDMA